MHRSRTAAAAAALIAVALAAIVFWKGADLLVIDNRQKSDAIVITQGDQLDGAYWIGLRLLKDGYGRVLLIDARVNRIFFGRSQADMALDFIQKTAADLGGRVKVCPITADTTAAEVYQTAKCLQQTGARSVLLLSDDYHTRRSLLTFSHILPAYHWSAAPVPAPDDFGRPWWRKREWIRTTVVQWQHLLWWAVVDRWRFAPIRGLGAEQHDRFTAAGA